MYIKRRDTQGKIVKLPDGKPQEDIEIWHTRFISDVFLFIAPEGYIDSEQQMNKLLSAAELAGAASAHRLISIDDLIKTVENSPQEFTDDIVYMCSEKKKVLVEFSEAIKFIFKKR